MPKMQAKVDVGKFVVQYGPGMYQMPHKCVSAQATPSGEAGRPRRFGPVESTPSASLPKMQGTRVLLQEGAVIPFILF